MVSGRRFDCKHLQLIDKYRLTDKYKIKQEIPVKRPGSKGFTFVTASSIPYYNTMKKLLFNLKKQFGCSQKIIGYDLGEYDTFTWMDSAIVLNNGSPLNSIFDGMENSTISEVVFPGSADPPHGVQFATNVRTYNFIPLVSNLIKIENKWDERMIAAGFNIMHKSEYTRQLLKWALLCAATKQCINPEGSKLACPGASSTPSCHRFDQSVFALLTINSEYQRYVLDNGETDYINL
uniref:Glucuronosyltransferase n=1 Tax=Meloidogyne javanica TaxID=6303 RepID=A0A915LV64_MELJA